MRRALAAATAALAVMAVTLGTAGAAAASPPVAPGPPLAWGALSSADRSIQAAWDSPESTGGSTITAYAIQLIPAGGTWVAPPAENVTVDVTARTAVVTGLVNGTAYRLRVAAVNSAGQGPWLTLPVARALTPSTTPGRPATWVSAVGAEDSATLTWTAPTDDGGSPVTSYRVDKTADGGATWTVVRKSTGSAATTLVVTGLANGTGYRFRVSAINARGIGPALANSPRVVPGWPDLALTVKSPATAALGWTSTLTWTVAGGPRGSAYETDVVVKDAVGAKVDVTQKAAADGRSGQAKFTVRIEGAYTVKVKALAISTDDPSKTSRTSVTNPLVATPTFKTSVSKVTAADVPYSYRAGCPVTPDQLRTVRMPYWDFDGHAHLGRMVVRSRVVDDILFIFKRIYRSGFRINSMIPIDEFYGGGSLAPDAADRASMSANNTSAFNCRPVVGYPGQVSPHSSGEALDINPVQNPYVTDKRTYPSGSGEAYHVNRADHLGDVGVIAPGSPVVRAFFRRSWIWGANWRQPDYQHWQSRYPMTYGPATDTSP